MHHLSLTLCVMQESGEYQPESISALAFLGISRVLRYVFGLAHNEETRDSSADVAAWFILPPLDTYLKTTIHIPLAYITISNSDVKKN